MVGKVLSFPFVDGRISYCNSISAAMIIIEMNTGDSRIDICRRDDEENSFNRRTNQSERACHP